MTCERFDHITASCSTCCLVRSYRWSGCEKEKTAPVLEHRNGQGERALNTLFSAYSLPKTKGEIQV